VVLAQGSGVSITTNANNNYEISATVPSVFGRTGSVTAQSGDYSHGQLSNIGSDDHHSRYADSEARSAVVDNKLNMGEGLTLTSDQNYFGTNLDARIFRASDTGDDPVDGGIVFEGETNGSTYEWLTIRDPRQSYKNFHYGGNEIWHAGNDGDIGKLSKDEAVTGLWEMRKFRFAGRGADDGSGFKQIHAYNDSDGAGRMYMAPRSDGEYDFSKEFGFDWNNQNWYVESHLAVGSVGASYTLDVNGKGAFSSKVGIGDDPLSDSQAILSVVKKGNPNIVMQSTSSTGKSGRFEYNSSEDEFRIQYGSGDGSYGGNTAMRIDLVNNKVGVGTGPSYAFDAAGTVRAQGALRVSTSSGDYEIQGDGSGNLEILTPAGNRQVMFDNGDIGAFK